MKNNVDKSSNSSIPEGDRRAMSPRTGGSNYISNEESRDSNANQQQLLFAEKLSGWWIVGEADQAKRKKLATAKKKSHCPQVAGSTSKDR